MAGFPSNWTEVALVTIVEQLGSTVLELAAPTSSIDLDAGDKEIETRTTLGGGRVEQFTPEEDTVITLEGYYVGVNPNPATAEDKGLEQLFYGNTNVSGIGGTSWDTSEPVAVQNSRFRRKYNIALMWTQDATPTSAMSGASIGFGAKRFIAVNARLVSLKTAYTDGEQKVTIKFRIPAFQKNGNSNMEWQSGRGNDSTETLLNIVSLGVVSLGPVAHTGQMWV